MNVAKNVIYFVFSTHWQTVAATCCAKNVFVLYIINNSLQDYYCKSLWESLSYNIN